jgi:hypothetical protein
LGATRRSTRRWAPRSAAVVRCGLLHVEPWAPTMDSQSVASQFFAVSLFPYLGFLYFMTRFKTAPGLTLFGFILPPGLRQRHQYVLLLRSPQSLL